MWRIQFEVVLVFLMMECTWSFGRSRTISRAEKMLCLEFESLGGSIISSICEPTKEVVLNYGSFLASVGGQKWNKTNDLASF